MAKLGTRKWLLSAVASLTCLLAVGSPNAYMPLEA